MNKNDVKTKCKYKLLCTWPLRSYFHEPQKNEIEGRHVNFVRDPLRSYFYEPQKNENFLNNVAYA